MIKRTLYFGNPVYLSVRHQQLCIAYPSQLNKPEQSVPIEDIGMVVFDHGQLTYTHSVVSSLIDANCAMLWCDEKHTPSGMVLHIAGNSTFTEALRTQLNASEPLKKQLWKQTIQHKIRNQARVLSLHGHAPDPLLAMADKVGSGDPENMEGRAASRYWDKLLEPYGATRGRNDGMPNAFFNYGYAILRAITARSLVASGFLPAMGIHHSNKYNAFCLADDVMEPYRPVVDAWVFERLKSLTQFEEALTKDDKQHLLQIPVLDVWIDGKQSPLMNAMQRTTAGLMACYEGTMRKIPYPEIPS